MTSDNQNKQDASEDEDEVKQPVAGSFFNPVPPDANKDKDSSDKGSDKSEGKQSDEFEDSLRSLMQKRNAKPLASQPSTVGGVPTSKATGFGTPKTNQNKPKKGPRLVTGKRRTTEKPYIGIGPTSQKQPPTSSINDPNNPQYDDQGYTLYADEETGQQSRVFEALVNYPCVFNIKIVGANEGTFVQEMLQLVADSCQVEDVKTIKYGIRNNGKWTSLTVGAPVKSSEMLYELYERIDADPRVRFKF